MLDIIKNIAIQNKFFLKAPNKEVSNLSEYFWLYTRTQDFKNFFTHF